MNDIKVLIVDDDAILGATLTLGLQSLGMLPTYQTSLAGLKSVVEASHPNIILLDVEVGTNNSIELMQQLKLYASGIPVIFMTSHIDAGYLTQAMGEGAVAFLKKPIEIDELTAYILRFANTETPLQNVASMVSIGKYKLDIDTRELFLKDQKVCRLTAKQFQLLRILLEHPKGIISRQAIKQELWPDGNSSDASLDNYISQLRKILTDDSNINIMTIPKIGFKLIS